MNFNKSLKRAILGIKIVWQSESNFRIEVCLALLVVIMMIVLPTTYLENAVLLLLIGIVLVLEILNSTWERIIDLLKPRLNHYVGAIKDMLAASVLLAAILSIIIGIIIFSRYFF
ncbi:MAG: diacylglycerol kinase [Candidatus Komeilibacteria bacterium CG_4_10_14_0_2_um_filter_37_10]|uniref:Diacylglycerol kinase n=1 Tax=Candidatus Komeilibacteria bacterium CG_4_10_14_0_2_um_filter_37_10 TaxID=1974470 RepID=A0A2M7VDW8_9BACT|nr:MAG: diacylglycerol kinase [Candidatus Komeilibacteria bacterium CG_4_10_14_0_2_um_filter_37_10]PJA92618.1 MAG: diacylglycerol kinase [Candidatus Komeilibacteria bacterium CG_4_9_14_3_um_filter_37_5]